MVAFLFQRPDYGSKLSPKAADALSIASLVERLTSEKRKRVGHATGELENVAEHTLMVAKVSLALAEKYYPELDVRKVMKYALSHDDVEAYVGDTPTGEWANTDYVSKQAREEQGLEQLANEFGDSLPAYVQTSMEYERQIEPEARFVRMVDKLAVLLMHIVDGGRAVNEHFDLASYISNEAHRRGKMAEYTDWQEMINLMQELANYTAEQITKTDRP